MKFFFYFIHVIKVYLLFFLRSSYFDEHKGKQEINLPTSVYLHKQEQTLVMAVPEPPATCFDRLPEYIPYLVGGILVVLVTVLAYNYFSGGSPGPFSGFSGGGYGSSRETVPLLVNTNTNKPVLPDIVGDPATYDFGEYMSYIVLLSQVAEALLTGIGSEDLPAMHDDILKAQEALKLPAIRTENWGAYQAEADRIFDYLQAKARK